MDVGEKMSEITDVDAVVEGLSGLLYENRTAQMIGRPLDAGRMLYFYLHQVASQRDEIRDYEVYWNHALENFTIVIRGEIGIRKTLNEEQVVTWRAPLKEVIQSIIKEYDEIEGRDVPRSDV